MTILEKGYSHKARHLTRTHGVSLKSLQEWIRDKKIAITYIQTTDQIADILTKPIVHPAAWHKAMAGLKMDGYSPTDGEDLSKLEAPTRTPGTKDKPKKKAKPKAHKTKLVNRPRNGQTSAEIHGTQPVGNLQLELKRPLTGHAETVSQKRTRRDRKSTRLNSSHSQQSRMPSSA